MRVIFKNETIDLIPGFIITPGTRNQTGENVLIIKNPRESQGIGIPCNEELGEKINKYINDVMDNIPGKKSIDIENVLRGFECV